MALVMVRGTREVLEGVDEVAPFLAAHGIRHQRWGADRLPEPLRGRFALAEDEKALVLRAYEREIRGENDALGYVAADVVALAPDLPGLAAIAARFDKEHTHSDDEVRFVVAGHGTFTVRGTDDRPIDITLGPGDYISVPRDRRHWFTLLPDRRIVTVRLFKDQSGWAPLYCGTGTGPTEIPRERLTQAFGMTLV